jgi:hypothetical protein
MAMVGESIYTIMNEMILIWHNIWKRGRGKYREQAQRGTITTISLVGIMIVLLEVALRVEDP